MKTPLTNEWLRKGIESDPDDDFCGAGPWCPRCGDPLPQDPEAEKQARTAGMCLLCQEAVSAGH